RVAARTVGVGYPREHKITAMFLMAHRTVRFRDTLLMLADGMAGPAGAVLHRAQVGVAAQQAGRGLESFDVADAAIIVEHGVGARHRPRLVDETKSGPPGNGYCSSADNKDQPSRKRADTPNAARLTEIIELDPVG